MTLKVTQHLKDKLVIRQFPVFVWIFGIIVFIIGFVFLMPSLMGSELVTQRIEDTLFGFAFVTLGMSALVVECSVTLTLDKQLKRMFLKLKGCAAPEQYDFPLERIAGIRLYHSGQRFALMIELSHHRLTPFAATRNKQAVEDHITLMTQFLAVPRLEDIEGQGKKPAIVHQI